jgi:hypothetical protein
MSQTEADKTLDELRKFIEKQKNADGEMDAYAAASTLGVVVWILWQGLVIPCDILEKAERTVQVLLDCEDYINDWKIPEKRVKALEAERISIRNALANNGKGSPREVAGLFDKIGRPDDEV